MFKQGWEHTQSGRVLTGELCFQLKALVCRKLKLSAATCHAMFVFAKQQGQGTGCDCQWYFGLFPGVVLALANWELWLMGAGDSMAQGWLLGHRKA